MLWILLAASTLLAVICLRLARRGRLNLSAGLPGGIRLLGVAMAELKIDQKLPLFIAPTDPTGKPAAVNGILWAVSDSELASINVSENGLSAEVVPIAVGSLSVSVSARNVNDEVLTESVEVVISEAEPVASALNLTVGAPVPRA